MGRIVLDGMKFFSHIGTTGAERDKGSEVTVDLSYVTETSKAGETDDLSDAVDYSKVYETVKKETEIPCNLIENLAHRIMKSLKRDFPTVSYIELKLFKHYPQVDGCLEKSGIILTD